MKKPALLSSLLMVCALHTIGQTYTLHWGSTSWTGPTYNKTVTNIGGSGINATISIVNTSPGGNTSSTTTSTTNDAFQNNTPSVGPVTTTNWFLPGSTAGNPLVESVDWLALTSSVVTTVSFSRPVNSVSLYVGDMDRTNPLTYIDRFTFTGKRNGVAVSNPVLTKFQANTGTGPDTVLISGNSAFGNQALAGGNSNTTSIITQGATVYVEFSYPITDLVMVWDQGPGATGDPARQTVAIGDISFTKVIPEYPPTADNFTNRPMSQANAATAIPGLAASDLDGTVANYKIKSVPTAAQGVISIPCPFTPNGATCTGGFADLTPAVLTANAGTIIISPAQAAAMRFDPAGNFTGNAQFTFVVTDNDSNLSNIATYILPVISSPPVSNNIMANSMINTNAATAIPALNSSDVDGTIASYQITSLPTTGQGVLSVSCPPNLTGGTCTGGFEDLTAAVLANYPLGIPLTATQIANLRFDPAAGFVGNAVFNYNAVDNNGNTSNTANYTIPVAATAATARPPLADNIMATPVSSSASNTAIPQMQANDLDGTVASYKVLTIPSAGQGVLRISCPSTPAGLTCTAGFADVLVNTVFTPAEAARLFFDPAANFTGTASFTYTATDNKSLVSNTATYNLPVTNASPVATNINTFVPFNAAATAIPALTGTDADGTITAFTITTVPTAAQGTLSVPCPPNITGGTCTGGFTNLTPAVLTANAGGIVLTATQAAGIRFAPTTNFSGTAPFNYTTTDNNGNISIAAAYNITMAPQPPVSIDIVNTIMPNTNAATVITALSATDADGTIASYTILSVPDPTQGVLSIPCGATPPGATCTGGFADLTPAVLAANLNGISITPAQAAGLRFDPTGTPGFTGLAAFKYGAVDNSGLFSNVSTYTLPVSGTGNVPPVAKNITASPMPVTNGATAILALPATDPDGTIAGYILNTVPSASQGVLSVPCPPNITGATCTGGFQDLTPAVLAANATGIALSPAQAAAMRFDPAVTFSGVVEFAYTATDNTGASSAGAVYSIPVTSLIPVANPVVAPAMPQTNAATAIPAFVGSDPNGTTLAGFAIENLPPVSQGVISIPCPPTLSGTTCTGGFQDLTAAVLAAYPNGGIVLTATQASGLRFDPAASFTGTVVFNYHAIDSSGLISNATTYSIPVTGSSPISKDVLSQKILNSTVLPTAIPSLNSTDPDGTISSYIITSIPPTSQGVISIPCPPSPSGGLCVLGFEDLTAAVLTANPGGISLTPTQAAGLRFAPSNTFIGNAAFNYLAYDNNNNLSNTATYTIPAGTAAALPLTLINFSGERNNDDIIVKWKSEAEINVSRFDIEYSTDGIGFTSSGTVAARNQPVNNYQYTLVSFTQPLYYLRLKSIDADGSFKYSPVITIRNSSAVKKAMSVTPNPVTDKIQLIVSSDVAVTARFQVVTTLGQVLYESRQPVIKGTNLVTLQKGTLQMANATYYITALVDGRLLVSKFILNK